MSECFKNFAEEIPAQTARRVLLRTLQPFLLLALANFCRKRTVTGRSRPGG